MRYNVSSTNPKNTRIKGTRQMMAKESHMAGMKAGLPDSNNSSPFPPPGLLHSRKTCTDCASSPHEKASTTDLGLARCLPGARKVLTWPGQYYCNKTRKRACTCALMASRPGKKISDEEFWCLFFTFFSKWGGVFSNTFTNFARGSEPEGLVSRRDNYKEEPFN